MAKKKEETKEIAVTQTTALSVAGYEQFAGQGFEGQTAEDYAIPFLGILQPLSPQLESNPELRPGMIFNTVTGEAFRTINFVPATTTHCFVEWKPRDQGGGFVAQHAAGSEVVTKARAESKEFGKYRTPAGNDLVETFYAYGIATDDKTTFQAVIAFTSTKIKRYRMWQTKAKTIQIVIGPGRRIQAPLFSHRYRLSTILEKRAKGTSYNWVIDFDGADAEEARLPTDSELFQGAVAIKTALESGQLKAAVSTQDIDPDDATEEAPF